LTNQAGSGRGSAAVLAAAALAGALAACGSGTADDGAVVLREVAGDTTIVRTSGVGPWGGDAILTEEVRIGVLEGAEAYTFGRINALTVDDDGAIYVLDSQTLNVRVYGPEGAHLRTFGRSGGGPGELKQPSGMAFLPDGRLAVRDFGNTRINLYGRSGDVLGSLPIPGGFFTSSPIFADRHGFIYTDVIIERTDDGRFFTGLLRIDTTGVVQDTMRPPLPYADVPRLIAESQSTGGRSISFSQVPFWPVPVSTLSPAGEFVGGTTDRYAIHTWHADGTVQRIERQVEPVPVQAGERATRVEEITRSMRRTDPGWRWNGPQPPEQKPAFKAVRVAADGRIWVGLSRPAERQPPDPDARPDPGGLPALDRWVEPGVWDVFESDGAHLGTVRLPPRFTIHFMRGDYVWGTIRDEFDVDYVVRMRIRRTGAGAGTFT
jgi:hypothetical protein